MIAGIIYDFLCAVTEDELIFVILVFRILPCTEKVKIESLVAEISVES